MDILKVTGVSKKISEDFMLTDISFTQREFQHIAIAGETGSGKSTLLKIIAGFEQPDSGEILLGDRKLRGPNYQLIPGHEGIAYLSQYFELRNWYRVEEVLAMASNIPDEDADRIFELCQVTHLLKRRTDQLSGGEKQRIALARLLITAPRLLILDEPFSNADMIHKGVLKSVIEDISRQLGITCIMTAHDPLDLLPWADELFIMRAGQIIQQGSSKHVYNKPIDEYTAGLLGSYNLLSGALASQLGLPAFLPGDAPAILRPHQLALTESVNDGVHGIIRDIRYFGSYNEAVVALEDNTLLVRIEGELSKKGDKVGVKLKQVN